MGQSEVETRPVITTLKIGFALIGLSAALQIAEWQAAVEAMLLVVELNGSTMVARIGVMRALNRGYVREFNSSRKDTHWGRQLARDR